MERAEGRCGQTFCIEISGNPVQVCKRGGCLCSIPRDANGSWDNYTTVKGKLSKHLDVGKQIIRIAITGPYCNIDKIVFTNTLDTDVEIVPEDIVPTESDTYNLYGIKVDGNYKGIVVKDGQKLLNR